MLLPTPFLCCGFYASDTFVAWVLPRRAGKADGESPLNDTLMSMVMIVMNVAVKSLSGWCSRARQ